MASTNSDPLLTALNHWEERFRGGEDLTPARLAPDRPDLWPEIAERTSRLRLALLALRTDGTVPQTPAHYGAVPVIPGYRILGELGRGAMGVVYRAEQLSLGRVVALKTINASLPSPERAARVRTEATALARLNHPNIVQVFESGESDGRPYFALEYVAGGTLAQRLRSAPPDACAATALVETVARAVHEAHEAGVLHRDLKPSNVLLDRADSLSPKVADFGLARLVSADAEPAFQTQSGAVLGTPAYMAPEQADGQRDIGPAADVYSLGAILYECLTGRPPFSAGTPLRTLNLVLTSEPTPVRRLRRDAPAELAAICARCLDKSPARRPASAAALADELHDFLDGRRARRPAWPAAAVLGVVLAAIAAGVAVRWRPQPPAVPEKSPSPPAAVPDKQIPPDAAPTLAERIDELRLHRLAPKFDERYLPSSGRRYDALFREQGLDPAAAPHAFGDGVARHADRGALVAALDDWSFDCAHRQRHGYQVERPWKDLLAAAEAADGATWRRTVRRAALGFAPLAALKDMAAAIGGARAADEWRFVASALATAGDDAIGETQAQLRRVLADDPNDFWALQQLGWTIAPFDAPGAYECYAAACQLRPESAAALGNLACALVRRDLPGDRAVATEMLDRLMGRQPGEPLWVYYAGLIAALYGDAVKSEALARRAGQMDDGFAAAHFLRGTQMIAQGRLQDALGPINHAIALDPTTPRALDPVLIVYDALNNPWEAFKVADSAAARNPRAWTWYYRGRLLLRLGRLKDAERDFRGCIAERKTYEADHLYLGLCLMAQGRPKDAVEPFRAAKTYRADGQDAQLGLAEAMRELGHYDQAAAVPQSADTADWQTFRRELAELVALDRQPLDALLNPADRRMTADPLRLAELCVARQRPADALRLVTDAIQAGQTMPNRADAARVAVRAALVADVMDRGRYRQQALTWLREELDRKRVLLGDGKNRRLAVEIHWAVRAWTEHADFAPLRAGGLLHRVDSDAFWRAVEDLANACQPK